MSVLFRCRVEPEKLAAANRIVSELGTSIPEVFRMVLAEIVRTKRVPLSLTLEETEPLINRRARNKIWRELDDTQDW